MTSSTSDRAARHRRVTRGVALALGLTSLVLATADVYAGSKADFGGEASAQIASLSSPTRLVDADALADQRAKGAEAAGVAADGTSAVAVILWDDAWSELQRRNASASAGATGANANSSLAGSNGN